MAHGRRLGIVLPCFVFLVILALARLHTTGAVNTVINRKIGIQFLSFSYTSGALPNGKCCDDTQPVQGGQCPPDTCDTAFSFCVTHQSNGSTCDPSIETTPLLNNNSVTLFGKKIDPSVANGTFSLVVFSVDTMEDINIEVSAKEIDENAVNSTTGIALGNFTLVLNSTHLYTRTPHWQTYHFDNKYIRLGLNVTSFCSRYYYPATSCTEKCMERPGQFTCNRDSGDKVCSAGYEGPNCDVVTDLCVSSPCRNKGVCQKQVNDFSCTCQPGFTGKTCDSVAPSTTSPGQTQSSVSQTAAHSPSGTDATTKGVTTDSPSGTAISMKEKGGSPGGTNIGVIVGPVAALLLLAAAAAVLFFLWFRKRKRTVEPEKELTEKESPDSIEKEIDDAEKPEKPTAPLATQASNGKASDTAIDIPQKE